MHTDFKQGYFFKFFLFPLFMVWLIGLLFLFAKGYDQSFLLLNSYHFAWLDFPMLLITMLGDAGFMAVLMIFVFIRKQPYQLIMLLIAIILSGILAQIFKNFFFENWQRPPYLFKEQVHTVGSYLLYHHSFPSGHSSTVAAVFTMLAYFRKEHKTEIFLYAIVCPFIAYTRVYLGVHFLGDTLAGILLGCSTSVLILFLIKPFKLNLRPRFVLSLRTVAIIAAVSILAIFFVKYL